MRTVILTGVVYIYRMHDGDGDDYDAYFPYEGSCTDYYWKYGKVRPKAACGCTLVFEALSLKLLRHPPYHLNSPPTDVMLASRDPSSSNGSSCRSGVRQLSSLVSCTILLVLSELDCR